LTFAIALGPIAYFLFCFPMEVDSTISHHSALLMAVMELEYHYRIWIFHPTKPTNSYFGHVTSSSSLMFFDFAHGSVIECAYYNIIGINCTIVQVFTAM
jgi:hypothetical protein